MLTRPNFARPSTSWPPRPPRGPRPLTGARSSSSSSIGVCFPLASGRSPSFPGASSRAGPAGPTTGSRTRSRPTRTPDAGPTALLPCPPPRPRARGGGHSVGADASRRAGLLDIALGRVFGVHLHNQCEKAFPKGGWIECLLLDRYDKMLGYARATERRGSAEDVDGEGAERT
jgi:hypothetical protein